MREDGVIISTTGANEDILKVRPPLIFQALHVDKFLTTLERALNGLCELTIALNPWQTEKFSLNPW